MKKLLLLVVVLGLLVGICYSADPEQQVIESIRKGAPKEFVSCGSQEFSFKELEYYERKELEQGYCCCKLTETFCDRLIMLSLKLQLLLVGNEWKGNQEKQNMKKYMDERVIAINNQSRILRILKKKYNVDPPVCLTIKGAEK